MRSSKFLLLPAMTVLASLLAAPAFSANYRLKVSIPDLPPAVWPSCTTPWGSGVAHGGKVFAYSAGSVPFGSTCDTAKEERSCSKGVLSGAYAHPACEVLTACPGGGTQVYATPGSFTFTLPEGCASATLTAKAWGAGGTQASSEVLAIVAPGVAPGGLGTVGATGGAGGFATSSVQLTQGVPVTVVVGGAPSSSTVTYYRETPFASLAIPVGGGGGASAVLEGGSPLVVAGGGGSYTLRATNSYVSASGFRGRAGGETCPSPASTTGSTGGVGGRPHYSATYLAGHYAGGTSSYGAGGGSSYSYRNYYGTYMYDVMGGGGGGYVGGRGADLVLGGESGPACGGTNYARSGSTSAGSAATPGGVGDSAYAAGSATPANPGRVVLTWQ